MGKVTAIRTSDWPAAENPPARERKQRQAHITVRGLSKKFQGTTIYDDFSIDLPMGKFISVFGPNGCGKSTLINMISGLMPMDAGEVLYDGQSIRDTRISYVFQNYREALFPWMRAIDNIRYPLRLLGLGKAEIAARLEKLLALFAIRLDLRRYPYELSGGQQQLISIMRALVVEPEVLFLDEPFSALDYEMTLFVRDTLQRVLTATRTTTLLVSHDLEEAIFLADRVMLLSRRPSRIADQVDIPLPWPRGAEVLARDDFVALKRYCLAVFQREVRG